ncbi:MAG: hypothetical protein INR73_28195 [Williamsia sp.]|nr:hypothetical protein [Williamsia sp.]
MNNRLTTHLNQDFDSADRLTPRQLINLHMMNPEKSITDHDIDNLILGSSAVDLSFLGAEREAEIMTVVSY